MKAMTINERCREMLFGMYLTNAGIGDQIQKLRTIGYFEAPASKGHHLALKGGLVTHSVNVTRELLKLTETMGVKWPREESPYLVGLLHDLVKCRCYRAVADAEQDGWEYVQPEYPGHGIASVMIAEELGIELRPEEIAAITYHMGMFGVAREYTDKEFNAALAKYPQQIIATHCADWWAARVTEEGVFAVADKEQSQTGGAR